MAHSPNSTFSDNTVVYRIWSSKLTFKDEISIVEQCFQVINTYCPNFNEYIWHNEAFHLEIIPRASENYYLLEGSTNFEHCIDDEWYIVYLLQLITKHINGLYIQTFDSDGEILLIEAAERIPSWINPESSANRVFIVNGLVHIISKSVPAESICTVEKALQCLESNLASMVASSAVQDAILARTNAFPKKVQENFHHAVCYVPANLAALLQKYPKLIAAGVRSLCNRTPELVKSCVTMKYFRPGTRVRSRIRFTKCSYAQLYTEEFMPERKSDWSLPTESDPHYKEYIVGVKLAYGFEFLGRSTGTDVGNRWKIFVERLASRGYFGSELAGSAKYQELEQAARRYFEGSVEAQVRSTGCAADTPAIAELLRGLKFDLETMRKESQSIAPSDSDAWMHVDRHQLDAYLSRHFGHAETDTELATQAAALEEVVDSVQKFVKKESSYKGAELSDEENEIEGFRKSLFKDLEKMRLEDCYDTDSDMDEYASSVSDDDVAGLRQHAPQAPNGAGQRPKARATVRDFMDVMDAQLNDSVLPKSFKRRADGQVDVEANLAAAVLDSADSHGLCTPAGNLVDALKQHSS